MKKTLVAAVILALSSVACDTSPRTYASARRIVMPPGIADVSVACDTVTGNLIYVAEHRGGIFVVVGGCRQ